MEFYIVDVFGEKKYSGNQLAVVRGARRLSKNKMQQIAKEFNFSETSFILDEHVRSDGYNVRIFTPAHEVPFAGHPTLGTAYVIQKMIIGKRVSEISLNLKAGKIPVTFKGSVLWMRQRPATFGKALSPEKVAVVLGLSEEDIDQGFPIQEVSTGLPHLIIPLRTLDSAKKVTLRMKRYLELIKTLEAKSLLVFCRETENKKNDLHVRVFAPYYGIIEDPATGSGNGCLASYLVKNEYFGEKKISGIRVEQGYEIGRPSLLYLDAISNQDKTEAKVGGSVYMVASGELD